MLSLTIPCLLSFALAMKHSLSVCLSFFLSFYLFSFSESILFLFNFSLPSFSSSFIRMPSYLSLIPLCLPLIFPPLYLYQLLLKIYLSLFYPFPSTDPLTPFYELCSADQTCHDIHKLQGLRCCGKWLHIDHLHPLFQSFLL